MNREKEFNEANEAVQTFLIKAWDLRKIIGKQDDLIKKIENVANELNIDPYFTQVYCGPHGSTRLSIERYNEVVRFKCDYAEGGWEHVIGMDMDLRAQIYHALNVFIPMVIDNLSMEVTEALDFINVDDLVNEEE